MKNMYRNFLLNGCKFNNCEIDLPSKTYVPFLFLRLGNGLLIWQKKNNPKADDICRRHNLPRVQGTSVRYACDGITWQPGAGYRADMVYGSWTETADSADK